MPNETAELQDDPDTLVVIDGDEAEGSPPDNDDTPAEPTEAEKIAALMGWRPKSEWKGDDGGWKPAEDFLAEVPEKLKDLRRGRANDRAKLDSVAALVAKLSANQRRDMDARLEAELEAASEAGDVEAVKRIVAQIKKGDEPHQSPAVAAFRERNSTWFEVDVEATAYADLLDRQYAAQAGGKIVDHDAHLKRVESAVRKRFPELFPAAEPEKAKEPAKPAERAPLAARGSRAAGSVRAQNGVITVADLTPKQRRGAEESGVSYEDYAKALTKIHAASAR